MRSKLIRMEAVPPPRYTGRRVPSINLNGYLVPFYEDNQPMMIRVPGSIHVYIVCFSTPEKLEDAKKFIEPERVKQITDFVGFLQGLPVNQTLDESGAQLKIMVDPWVTPEGKTRYLEILFD